MRLEHHLVGGYVRYISPYIIIIIIIIIIQNNFLRKFPVKMNTYKSECISTMFSLTTH